MWSVVLDALTDSLIALPFLLAIYLLIEYLETNQRAKRATVRLLNGKLAPLVASGVGLVPQCGFSVMATDLYCQDYLRLGTLIAFFVATSDEALPILLTDRHTVGVVWIVILVKVVYAVLLGYLINLFDRRQLAADYTEHADEGCCHHDMQGKKGFWAFVKHPLLHTVKIFAYIFAVNAVFGLLLYFFGDEILSFTARVGFAQSFVTALIGLIPNCASSVIITGMYADGIISFAAMLAGLVSNSGIALAILVKERRMWKRSLLVIAVMYAAGVVLGVSAHFISLLF